MTKRYELIHLNDKMYTVDKTLKLKDIKVEDLCIEECLEIGTSVKLFHKTLSSSFVWKIVASNDTSLNLPLLPSVEENITVWEEGKFGDSNSVIATMHFFEDKNIVLKASAKKYADDDMKKAMEFAARSMNTWTSIELLEDGYEKLIDTRAIEHDVNRYLHSLNPKPIAVEVEIEYIDPYSYDSINKNEVKPKIINNIIQIVKWIYE